MKKNKLLIMTFLLSSLITLKQVYAYDVNNYKDRNLCGNYEVAGFHTDGYIDKVACFSSFNEAKSYMKIIRHY